MELKRNITCFAATLLVISAVIGSGVFVKVAPMAAALQSPGWILACWLVAGLLSLAGALCTAELAAMMPGSGGEFVYFRHIYGRFFAFLFGWANLAVMKSATIAALAFIFAKSFIAVMPLPTIELSWGGQSHNVTVKVIAISLIAFLSFVNYRGIAVGAGLSKTLIIAIGAAMLAFIVYAFCFYSGPPQLWQPAPAADTPQGLAFTGVFFAAALSAFWGYEGWNNVGYIGEEVKDPQRSLPIALTVGTATIIVLYMLMNAAYLNVMDVQSLAAITQTERIAVAVVADQMIGPTGGFLLSGLILVSTFNCTNTTILVAARVFYAMSRQKVFLGFTGKVHPEHQSPCNAIIVQGVWAAVLVCWGTFDQLTDLLIFAAFIFYGATALGVVILRYREPDAPRPYRVIGYPVLPIGFALFAFALVAVTIINQPLKAATGLGLIAAGIPVYWYYIRKHGEHQTAQGSR